MKYNPFISQHPVVRLNPIQNNISMRMKRSQLEGFSKCIHIYQLIYLILI